MNTLVSNIIGDIHITVYKTIDGENFFQIKATNESVLPILDIIEDMLVNY